MNLWCQFRGSIHGILKINIFNLEGGYRESSVPIWQKNWRQFRGSIYGMFRVDVAEFLAGMLRGNIGLFSQRQLYIRFIQNIW